MSSMQSGGYDDGSFGRFSPLCTFQCDRKIPLSQTGVERGPPDFRSFQHCGFYGHTGSVWSWSFPDADPLSDRLYFDFGYFRRVGRIVTRRQSCSLRPFSMNWEQMLNSPVEEGRAFGNTTTSWFDLTHDRFIREAPGEFHFLAGVLPILPLRCCNGYIYLVYLVRNPTINTP